MLLNAHPDDIVRLFTRLSVQLSWSRFSHRLHEIFFLVMRARWATKSGLFSPSSAFALVAAVINSDPHFTLCHPRRPEISLTAPRLAGSPVSMRFVFAAVYFWRVGRGAIRVVPHHR